MLFTRRKDLTPRTRVDIALSAMINKGVYGYITLLANTYSCSRLFVYQQLWALNLYLALAFAEMPRKKDALSVERQKLILLLRLEAKASIKSISAILKELESGSSSTGHISRFLKEKAEKLTSAITYKPLIPIIINSDEIFAAGKPILISVDPHSLAIVRIESADDRKADTWINHFDAISDSGIGLNGLVSDRGPGLTKAFQGADINYWFPDHFHEFRSLSKIIRRDLFKEACKAIENEGEKRGFESSVVEDKIALFDNSYYLLRYIQNILGFLDSDGGFRSACFIRDQVSAALDLMVDIENQPLKKQARKLSRRLDEILAYLQVAERVRVRLEILIADQEVLKAFCLAWRHEKATLTTRGKARKYHRRELKTWDSLAESYLGEHRPKIKEQVCRLLDSIPRTSSLIETVNSLIRPYLNSCKGKITPETLNLIMFYHNHRPFKEGKRKGKAPIEILTGKPLEKSWVDILLEDVG